MHAALREIASLSPTKALVDQVVDVSQDHDYLVKVVAASFASYETFLRNHLRLIPSLASIETTFAFGVTKARAPLPID